MKILRKAGIAPGADVTLGNVVINGTLAVTGTATFSNTVTASGTIYGSLVGAATTYLGQSSVVAAPGAAVSVSGNGINFQMGSASLIAWTNGAYNGTVDLGISRNAAGVVEINTGTPGTWGALKLKVGDPTNLSLRLGADNTGLCSSTNVVTLVGGGVTLIEAGTATATLGQWGAPFTLKGRSGGQGNANRAGTNLTIGPGESTGNGAAASLILQAGTTGASGVDQRENATVLTLTTGQAIFAAAVAVRIAGASSTNEMVLQGDNASPLGGVKSGLALGSAQFVSWDAAAAASMGTPDTALSRVTGGVVAVSNAAGGAGAFDFLEHGTDFAAPAANSARLYSRDNGSGKTQLVVRFPTGAVQVLATEP